MSEDFNRRPLPNSKGQTDKTNPYDLPGVKSPQYTPVTPNDNITVDWMIRPPADRPATTTPHDPDRRKSNSLEKALTVNKVKGDGTGRKEGGITRSDSAASRLSQNIFNQKQSTSTKPPSSQLESQAESYKKVVSSLILISFLTEWF